VTSRSRPGLVVVRKALAMARLSVVASPFVILPLHPSRFRPLAPHCPISWPLTANLPHRLAPSWSPPAGTLLLLTGWHPTSHHRWMAPPLPGGSARLPSLSPLRFTLPSQTLLRLRLIMVLHCLRVFSQTPTRRHLPVSPDREPACPLRRLAAPPFG